MEGFGVSYNVATQILGVNPGTSVFAISQDASAFTYDIRVWIWESTRFQWTLRNVDIFESRYFTYIVCNKPYIEGLFWVLGDGRMFTLYPKWMIEGENRLEMEMLYVSNLMTEELTVSSCSDEGWYRKEE